MSASGRLQTPPTPRSNSTRKRGSSSRISADSSSSRSPIGSPLVAYKTRSLNSINSNRVKHQVLDEDWYGGTHIGYNYAESKQYLPVCQPPSPRPTRALIRTSSQLPLPVPQVSPLGEPFSEPDDPHDCDRAGCERVRINVSGQYFETRVGLLNRHPDTLLGNPQKRQQFYDRTRDELFLDRHRPSFEAIFAYIQYGGMIRRPSNVPDDVFMDELHFYEIEKEVLDDYKESEGYTAPEEVVLPANPYMRKVWILFEYPETSALAFIIALISVIFTLTSIVLFCVETLPVFSMSHCVAGEAPNFMDPFFITETACTTWFTIEVVIRFIVCPSKLAFWKDFKNIIDVTAVVPYYVTFIQVMSTMSCESAKSSASLAFLRVIRLVRIFKLTKHSVGLQVLVLTFKASLEGLGLFLIALMVCLLVFSSAIYYAELGTDGSQMHSIPDAFWWAIITMTTVGYGDKVPVGVWGRLIGCMCALVGVLTLAIPVPIITGNFNRFYAHKTGRGKRIWGRHSNLGILLWSLDLLHSGCLLLTYVIVYIT